MGKSDEVLKQFISKKSIYFDLPDGQEEIIRYLSAESYKTVFKGKECDSIRYHFEHDGVVKLWDRTSRQLAKQMTGMEGAVLKIKRNGERNNTKYEIKKIE